MAKIHCPKCKSYNIFVGRAARSMFSKAKTELFFRCYKCSKRLYGQAVEDEVEKQLQEQEKKAPPVKCSDPEPESCHTEPPLVLRVTTLFEEKKREEELPQKEIAVVSPPKKPKPKLLQEEKEVPDFKELDIPIPKKRKSIGKPLVCSWFECGKPTAPRSKYCSRTCRNKNAHTRLNTKKRIKRGGLKKGITPMTITYYRHLHAQE